MIGWDSQGSFSPRPCLSSGLGNSTDASNNFWPNRGLTGSYWWSEARRQSEQSQRVHQSPHSLRQFLQDIGDRLTRTDLTLAERYSQGSLALHIRILLECLGIDATPTELCISCQRSPSDVARLSEGGTAATSEADPNFMTRGSFAYDYGQAVFVDIRKLVENPEGIKSGIIDSVVRLRFLNECECARIDPSVDSEIPYVGLLTVLDNAIFVQGEQRIFSGRPTFRQDEIVREMVKRTPQILDAVSDDEGNSLRDRDNLIDPHGKVGQVFSGGVWIQIGLHGDEFSLSLDPPGFLRLDAVEVLACPI